MLIKDLQSPTYSQINFKEMIYGFTSKKILKNKYCLNNKVNVVKKFNLKKKDSNTRQIKHKSQMLLTEQIRSQVENNILLRKCQLFQQKILKKTITKDLIYKMIGGGCRQSQFKIVQNPQQINFSQKKSMLDERFMQNYVYFTNKQKIVENIEYQRQGGMQVDIVQCLKSSNIHIRRDIIIYKSKLINLIDTYLIYVLAGSSQNEILKQNEIKELGSLLNDMKESFEMESRDQPSCDLIFYFDILYRFNFTRIGKDEKNKNQLIQAVEFITKIIKLGSGALKTLGGNQKEGVDLALKGSQFLLKAYQSSKTNQVFSYLLDIWVRKTLQFSDKIWNLTLLEELQFYITIFNELCSQKEYETDLVLLTLIKIDYYFSLAQEDQDNLKTLSQELSLNCALIKAFVPMLIQKSSSESIFDEIQYFLKFTVSNHTYRFLSISILLKYHNIIQNANDSQDYKEQILEYLCYKYLCEKNKSVKLAFEINKEFTDRFNSQIKQEQFQQKIIKLSNERRKALDLEQYEDKIENLQDIERMIANTIIDKWERDVKRRQQDNIAQKDDVLLEVKDLYIEQSITYLKGNKIIYSEQSQNIINEDKHYYLKSNALQEILDNFLQSSLQSIDIQNKLQETKDNQEQQRIQDNQSEDSEDSEYRSGSQEESKNSKQQRLQDSESENSEDHSRLQESKDNQKQSVLDNESENSENRSGQQKLKDDLQRLLDNKPDPILQKVIFNLLQYDENEGPEQIFKEFQQKMQKIKEQENISISNNSKSKDNSNNNSKRSINNNSNSNSNSKSKSNTNNNSNINSDSLEEQNKCKIIGILAEGGTGKSMFIKKLETHLIQSANSNQENDNYIPLLIKCNSLDPVQPSIENYLLLQGVNKQQINTIKNSNRNKVLLLDGYDEFTGEQFRVYKQLKLHEWKNTKVIVTSRKEKLELSDACANFSLDKDNGSRDDTSFCIVKLEEFTNDDILEYCKIYFRQYRTKEEQYDEQQYLKDMDVMTDCLKNRSLNNLLYLPINLYLFTRMIVQIKDKTEIQKIKEIISDQIGIQEIFFNEQFKREAQDFVQTQIKEPSKKNNDFAQLIINTFFEYFQSISIKMFLNKGKLEITNFLQIRKDKIEFKLPDRIENRISQQEKNNLFEKIINYVNSKIITRSKEEIPINQPNHIQNKSYLIEFKHKSLFEYFVARAMKYDFDVHGDNIYKLTIEQLKEFNINKKSIMNAGENQSEQEVLIKLYKMIKNEIESDDFYSNYHLKEIERNSRYIQYIKKSSIKNNTETSQIDIGASNMLSALFVSNFAYSQLELNYCSLSKLYVSRQKINNQINFDNCNLQNSFLKKFRINNDSCNTQFANFDSYQKIFDTSHLFSFNQVIWDKRNMLYAITKGGYIIQYEIQNQNNIVIQKSKQLSQTHLSQVLTIDSDHLLVSSQYSLLLINSISFELLQSFKFKNVITGFTKLKENFLVIFEDETVFHGSFKIGFRKMNIIATGCVYYESKDILLTYTDESFSLFNTNEKLFMFKVQKYDSYINSVAFSEDGKYLVTGSSNSICEIWDAEKGFDLLNTIQDHTDQVYSIDFSADGKFLATGSKDKTCKIWSVERGFNLINTLLGHTKSINSVTFTTDGKYLATCSFDNTCKIWDAQRNFELINTIKGHTDSVNSVAFSADGKYLASGSTDKTCKVWNVQKGFVPTTIIQDNDVIVSSIAFSANGKYLVTNGNTCKIWNVEKDFELISTIYGDNGRVTSVAFSVDGKYLVTASDQNIYLWNVEKGFKYINTIKGHTNRITSVAFSIDGRYLATVSFDKTCKIYNVEKNFELIKSIQGHDNFVVSVNFSADGKYLATTSRDSTCKIWNVEKRFQLLHTIEINDGCIDVAFSSDGMQLATSTHEGTCKIWNVDKGFELINTIEGHLGSITSIDFSSDGKYLATGSMDTTCKIWNIQKGFGLIKKIQGHTHRVNSVAFSPDRKYLATGSWDNTFKIWKIEQGFELIHTVQGHNKIIISVAFSPDGKQLATGSEDKTCKIWNAEKDFELINTIQGGHYGMIFFVAFSVDGKYLATASEDNSCRIWNAQKDFEFVNGFCHLDWVKSVVFSVDGKYLATGSLDLTCKICNVQDGFKLINTIKGHTGEINSVTFSADGKYMATGSLDTTCKIWNVEKDFELLKTIQGHTSWVSSVIFSSDGKYLVTGSMDQTCKIWNVEKDFELINTIQDYSEGVCSIAFSEDGKYLAAGQINHSCKIWNAEKGFQLIKIIYNHTPSIVSVDFSVDRKYVCIEQNDKCFIIYDTKNFKIIEKQSNYELLKEKYQLELNQITKLEKLRIFENIFIL